MTEVDVLVPTCGRPAPLAVTLAGLVGQTFRSFRVIVSNQDAACPPGDVPEVRAAAGVLRAQGRDVSFVDHLPRRGMAEHRQYLLDQATAPLALFLDDDVLMEPQVLARLVRLLRRERCGFVGAFVEAPGSVRSEKAVDEPLPGQRIELWDAPVTPEVVRPGTSAWRRLHLHFAARLRRLAAHQGLLDDAARLYRVAWVGGCVLFDVAALRAVGGFSFWSELPTDHVGEDALAQLRVMARFGGAGMVPSGAWHLEVPSTLPRRDLDAPLVLDGWEQARGLGDATSGPG